MIKLISRAKVNSGFAVQDLYNGSHVDLGEHSWRVLNIVGNKVLVILENIITPPLDDSDSEIYLNGEFCNTFLKEERDKIDGKITLASEYIARKYFKSTADRVAYDANGVASGLVAHATPC